MYKQLGILLALGLFVVSCQKKQLPEDFREEKSEIEESLPSGMVMETETAFVDFPSLAAFRKYWRDLDVNGYSAISNFKADKGIGTHPLEPVIKNEELADNTSGDVETLPFLDIVRLVNERGVVGIGDFIFHLNFNTRRVFVLRKLDRNTANMQDLENERESNPRIAVFGFDDQVFSRLGIETVCQDGFVPQLKQNSDAKNVKPNSSDPSLDARYKVKLRYDTYGIVALLKVKAILFRDVNGVWVYDNYKSNIRLKANGFTRQRCATERVNISFDRVYNNAVGLRKFYLYTGTRFLLNYNVNASVDDTKFGLPGIASTSLK